VVKGSMKRRGLLAKLRWMFSRFLIFVMDNKATGKAKENN
jgi:hypothetical protein